jgi:gelsolin
MAPHQGLVHPKEYDIKDSNVELIGSDIDHKVKHKSSASEPAWSNAAAGEQAGLHVWRIEDFEVVPWPKDSYGSFYDGDSYIVLHSYKLGKNGDDAEVHLGHDIFFWLGSHTTQDEAGTAAYKTVELDEYLHGVAAQHREVQRAPSDAFLALFPRMSIRRGGVRSGFHHVDQEAEEAARETIRTLLRIFKNPSAAGGPGHGLVVHEVEPHWQSLDDADVFVLDDGGSKIWVWQGKGCSPMEKAKAAQVVHDMTLAKHVDVEVVSQAESRSFRVVALLGGDEDTPRDGFRQARPVVSGTKMHSGGDEEAQQQQKLYRLSDASGQLSFELVKDGGGRVKRSDLDGNDVFLLDDGGRGVWVWEGNGASREEKKRWLQVAQAYLKRLQGDGGEEEAAQGAHLIPMAKVVEGRESRAFLRAIEV